MGAALVVELSLSAALLCAQGACYPALVGKGTPVGEFALQHVRTPFPGYGGDVLMFKEVADGLYAIHRTWKGRERLYANASAYRRNVTKGCVNVQPEVYDWLVSSGATRLVVRP